jgi:hypothetical protein
MTPPGGGRESRDRRPRRFHVGWRTAVIAYIAVASAAFLAANWRISWLEARIHPFEAPIDLATTGREQTFELHDLATASYLVLVRMTFPATHAALWDSIAFEDEEAQVRKDFDCEVEFDVTDESRRSVHHSSDSLRKWVWTRSRVETGATASLYSWKFAARSFARYSLRVRVVRGSPTSIDYSPTIYVDPDYNDFFSLRRPVWNAELAVLFGLPPAIWMLVGYVRYLATAGREKSRE